MKAESDKGNEINKQILYYFLVGKIKKFLTSVEAVGKLIGCF